MSASSNFHHFGALMCKVCNSPMKDARILFCGHSFCLECVEKLAQKDFAHRSILCPFNCAKLTPASIPPQDLTQNLTLQEVFHNPPHSTGPITPPRNDIKAIKNREALEKWKKDVEEVVVGLKAELKEPTEWGKTMELLQEGGLEALVDKEANKMLETWREPDAFDWEKAMEDLIRFQNAVQETLSDMDAFSQKMKQLLEEGFVRKEAELELELGQMQLEESPPHSIKGQEHSTDEEPPVMEQSSRGGGRGRGWQGGIRSTPEVDPWKEENLRPSPPTMEQWSRGGRGTQRRGRGRGQQPRFYRTKSDGGLGTKWISGMNQQVQVPVSSQQQIRGEARHTKKLSKTTGPAGFQGVAPFPRGRGYGRVRLMRGPFWN